MLGSNTQNMPLPYGNTGEWSGITQSGAGKFPNPFFDIASEYVPRNLLQIFEWAEYIYLTYGTYRSAARKVVRYFLTEVILEGGSEQERERYQELVDKKLHMLTQLAEVGDDYMVYGNEFLSMYFPFDRFLICPQCHTHYHIDAIPYKFSLAALSFDATCKKCQYTGEMAHEDLRSPDTDRIKLIRWNPKRIRLRVHDISGSVEYFYEPDARFVEKLRDGNRFYLNETPWAMVECCAQAGGDVPLFKFNKDSIYHMRESTLAGLPIKGWAIPPILPNFKLAYYIQVLRRYDEAVALDFIIPFRVLFPQGGAQGGINTDPLQMMSMDVFVGHMKQMVANRRRNVTDVQISPVAIGYEMLGGEAKALAPKDNIAQALDELLNAVGFPAELYRGSLSIQAFPVALRLFEKTWGSLVDSYNELLQWIMTRISRYYGWGPITASLRSVTLADDIERKALALQAAAGQDISKGTAYKPLGIDFMDEQKKVVEEQKEIQALQQEAMEESEAAQMGGPQGMQGGPGGQPGATPGDVNQQAKDMAYQLVTQVPESLRRGELIKIKQSNPTLHALVLQEMNTLRQDLARQGQAMMLQNMKQADVKMAGAGLLPSPLALGLQISTQIMEYRHSDLIKMARAIGRDAAGAAWIKKGAAATGEPAPATVTAFQFIYRRLKGCE